MEGVSAVSELAADSEAFVTRISVFGITKPDGVDFSAQKWVAAYFNRKCWAV